MGKCKIIVGRDELENHHLLSIAKRHGNPYLEVRDYMSPITLLRGVCTNHVVKKAAEITVRYSDAPGEVEVDVRYIAENPTIVKALSSKDTEIASLRIN